MANAFIGVTVYIRTSGTKAAGVNGVSIRSDPTSQFYKYVTDDYNGSGLSLYDSVKITCDLDDDYYLTHWVCRVDGVDQGNPENNPIEFSFDSGSHQIVIKPVTAMKPPQPQDTFYYACYDLTKEKYISGYTPNDELYSEDSYLYAPDLSSSGYTYLGANSHNSFEKAILLYYDEGTIQHTGTEFTTTDEYTAFLYNSGIVWTEIYDTHSAVVSIDANDYAKIAFSCKYSGTVTIYSTGTYEYDTYGYLTDDSASWNSSNRAPSSHLAKNDDSAGNRQFKITYDVTAGTTYFIFVKFYSSSTYGNTTIYVIPPSEPVFTATCTSAGTNAVTFNGSYNGQSATKVDFTINGTTYEVTPTSGSTSYSYTFTTSVLGLSQNTSYNWSASLYNNNTLISTKTGTVKTDQGFSGLAIYIGTSDSGSWKNAVPYIWSGSEWKKCSSRLYDGSNWKGG